MTIATVLFVDEEDRVCIDAYFDGQLIKKKIHSKKHSQVLAFHLCKWLFLKERGEYLFKQAPKGTLSRAMIQFKDDEKKGVLIDFTLGSNRKPGDFEAGIHGVEDIKNAPSHFFGLVCLAYILTLKSRIAKNFVEGTEEDFLKNCKELIESSIDSLFKVNNNPLF